VSFNSSGDFTIDTAGTPVVPDTDIRSSVFNDVLTELEQGLSTAICRDGQSTISQNIPFNNKNITNLAPGILQADAATIQNLIQQTGIYIATVGGTNNAITLTSTSGSEIQGYVTGMLLSFIVASTNSGSVTVNVDGLGAKAITKAGTIALVGGDLVAGMIVAIRYDGTRFQLQNPFYAEGSFTPSVGGNATYTTQLGRYTKIGRAYFIHVVLTINVLGTGSTSVISGLPAASYSGVGDQGLAVCDFASLATNVVWLGARVNSNATTITLRNLTAAGASATSSALLGDGTTIQLSGCYFTQ
jgi:hypothetical protein